MCVCVLAQCWYRSYGRADSNGDGHVSDRSQPARQSAGHRLSDARPATNAHSDRGQSLSCVGCLQVDGEHYQNCSMLGGSVAEWLACWTQVQNGPGSNCSRDAVG